MDEQGSRRLYQVVLKFDLARVQHESLHCLHYQVPEHFVLNQGEDVESLSHGDEALCEVRAELDGLGEEG